MHLHCIRDEGIYYLCAGASTGNARLTDARADVENIPAQVVLLFKLVSHLGHERALHLLVLLGRKGRVADCMRKILGVEAEHGVADVFAVVPKIEVCARLARVAFERAHHLLRIEAFHGERRLEREHRAEDSLGYRYPERVRAFLAPGKCRAAVHVLRIDDYGCILVIRADARNLVKVRICDRVQCFHKGADAEFEPLKALSAEFAIDVYQLYPVVTQIESNPGHPTPNDKRLGEIIKGV